MSRPFPPRSPSSGGSFVRVNGKIRAREVRVIGTDNNQLGIFSLADAINLARNKGVDLVEIAPTANPPVCRLVDYGKFRYEQSKKEKESRKHQHANKVKEIQLSPSIDPHDFGVKLTRAIDFLCEDMKVKVTLKFRGREMAHKEFGFQQIEKFTREVAPYGHPDNEPKLLGKGITVMFSPLPKNKRAKNPNANPDRDHAGLHDASQDDAAEPGKPEQGKPAPQASKAKPASPSAPSGAGGNFANNPFSQLDIKPSS